MTDASKKKGLSLPVRIIIGLVAGTGWAVLSSILGWSSFTMDWVAPFGDIFINLLKLIAIPLVLFSIISGVSGLSDITKLGRTGMGMLGLYLATTFIAVGIGLVLVNVIKPGEMANDDQRMRNRITYELWVNNTPSVDKPKDGRCLSCDPANKAIVDEVLAARQQESPDAFISGKVELARSTKEAGPLQFLVDMVPSNIFLSFNDALMLQVIFFAIFFGIVLLMIPPTAAAPVVALVNGLNDVFMTMVDVVMKAAPIFVFALMAGVVSRIAGDDPYAVIELFKSLAGYSVTVFIGLAIMVFGVYPTVMTLLMRRNIFRRFLKAISPAQLLAFSTSSSAATLPVTLECMEENIGVSKSTASFVLPIGATVNMDGTSLYQAVAVVFLAQYHMVDLTFVQQLSIVLTATLASIGAAAVPSAGLVTLFVVLTSLGLDPAWIAIILPVDRILDMCRTVVNVTGDATTCSVVAHVQGEKLFTKEV
ncbi:MAG TPA: dicarboxylate/amino acid:cation symporter [Flavobacteriales bacterium]|nr:dicarboxylate/amino acid:cation symporter [Flavobacteriales bacterium]MBK7618820.1 dicarboxylate/amino acid:cation symporter [Flavobacteriales bacterium]MBP9177779.1 dicarboxylate/amino acid:cation symporter [Flavobacteriales bacterium]HQW06860.1 dicarboxylate/amino acid:cation symporter [Flavobacteriales bacterium]HQW99335.1 dicarboxylate/amino acid:cation symporter [Flavobacteriales bacterium]